jgi:predicted O-methyltransferase YrrM
MQSDQAFEAYFAGADLTTNWTSRNYRLWANLLATRQHEPLDLLEIGSWEGRSALFFLNYLPRAHIVCIDTFEGSIEHRTWPFWRRWRQLNQIERRFDSNLAPFEARTKKIKGDSREALTMLGLAGRRFDFVYVDGSHVAADVYHDAVLSWPLLRDGGLLVFDDYQRKRGPERDRPAVGIDAFLDAFTGHYGELFRGHQIAIRKYDMSRRLTGAAAKAELSEPRGVADQSEARPISDLPSP